MLTTYTSLSSPQHKICQNSAEVSNQVPLPASDLYSYYSLPRNGTLLLYRFTNSFRHSRLEENYQLHCAKHHLPQARVYILCLIVLHGLYLTLAQHIDKAFLEIQHDSILDHFGYTLLAIPFAMMPTRWLDTQGGCARILVYVFRRRWKWAMAMIITVFTIELIFSTSAYSEASLRADNNLRRDGLMECTTTTTSGFLNAYLSRNPEGQMENQTENLGNVPDHSITQFLTQRSFFLTNASLQLLLILYITSGAMLVISIQLDFLQGLAVVATTVSVMGIALMQYHLRLRVDFEDAQAITMARFHPMIGILVLMIPLALILMALYTSDRISRHVYWAKLQAERDNTSLKSNLTTTSQHLILSDISPTEHQDVQQILSHHKDNSVLQAVSIPFELLRLESVIGVGASGEVLKGNYFATPVVVKRLSRDVINVQTLRGFQKQVELLACLRHPNIIQFIGASFNNSANICIVLEFMEEGDVRTLLHRNKTWTWYDPLCQIATDAAHGLNYLHENMVIHRDLKCANLLCSSTFGCKVSDFGTSRRFQRHHKELETIVGSPLWLSPEMLREEMYTIKSDCYAFGMVLLELETGGQEPYHDTKLSTIEVMMQVARGTLVPEIPPSCLPLRRKLIQDCLSFKPLDRPDVRDIVRRLQHDIRTELDDQFQQQNQLPVEAATYQNHENNKTPFHRLQRQKRMAVRCSSFSSSGHESQEEECSSAY